MLRAALKNCAVLKSGQLKGRTQQEIQDLVEKLASRDTYASHGSVIDHKEATTLGLQIEYLPPEDPIWERLWLLYCMYEHDCRKAKYLKVFEGRARSTAISIPPPQPAKAP